MPPRVRRDHRSEPDVALGGVDQLSQLAKINQLPMCGSSCTRARGHDEDPGSKHVHTHLGVVTAIWEDAP